MSNFPDDIQNYICKNCRELDPECICNSEDYVEQAFTAALYGTDEDTYYDMFDSQDSDIIVGMLREFHQKQSEENIRSLVLQLNLMLNNHIQNKIVGNL